MPASQSNFGAVQATAKARTPACCGAGGHCPAVTVGIRLPTTAISSVPGPIPVPQHLGVVPKGRQIHLPPRPERVGLGFFGSLSRQGSGEQRTERQHHNKMENTVFNEHFSQSQ